MQAAAPAGAYEPAGQSVQKDEPGSPAKEPAAQSVQVDEARMPSLSSSLPTVSPGAPRSARNAVMPWRGKGGWEEGVKRQRAARREPCGAQQKTHAVPL